MGMLYEYSDEELKAMGLLPNKELSPSAAVKYLGGDENEKDGP